MSEIAHGAGPSATPRINTVYMDRPWNWLARGWSDLSRSFGVGLVYGLAFAVIGAVLTYVVLVEEIYLYTFPLMAGFLLVGPLLAVGLYDTSRRLAAGQPFSLGTALTAFRENPTQIGMMGSLLLILMFAWVRIAVLLFFMFFPYNPPAPTVQAFVNTFLSVDAIPFLLTGNLLGLAIAAVVFAVSAISIPLLLDRPESNIFTAVTTSWLAVWRNPGTMALWAWLIVLFIAAGIATGFIGLIVTLPLIGHASWAAYKDLVSWEER